MSAQNRRRVPGRHSSNLGIRVDSCRTCITCRQKKVKCDGEQPTCGTCQVKGQNCVYPPDARRTAAQSRKSHVRSLQKQIEELQGQINAQSDVDNSLINDSLFDESIIATPTRRHGGPGGMDASSNNDQNPVAASLYQHPELRNLRGAQRENQQDPTSMFASVVNSDPLNRQVESVHAHGEPSSDFVEEYDVQVYGVTSLLHDESSGALLGNNRPKRDEEDASMTNINRDRLISFSAIGRQKENMLLYTPGISTNIDFDGIPMDTAMHLLNLHWNRQHLSYLLTYRPAIMDSLIRNGPYVNKLLLNAIYLQSSMYSDRNSLFLDPQDPQTRGLAFYNRFKALLPIYVDKPSMPTVVALLTCGACLLPQGKQSAGWLFCGMGYRMLEDLGYHLEIPVTRDSQSGQIPKPSAIEVEIRRRVYWGAYVSDKFQSLFLGRPPALLESNSNISRELLDTYEEMEEWKPYFDPQAQLTDPNVPVYPGRPSYALSTFQSLLQLCEVASRIIDTFFSIRSTKKPKSVLLRARQEIREQLKSWKQSLPMKLQFEPGVDHTPPPHQMTLHTTYWTLLILVEQAFLKNSNFDFMPDPKFQEECRQNCIQAAFKIWKLVEAYKDSFTLRRAQYGISYATCCAAHVILQQTHHDQEEYIECIRFFWYALLELQRGCNNGLRKPLNLLKSIMRRAAKVAQRINLDASEVTEQPRPDYYGLEPVFGAESIAGIDIGSWGSPVLNDVTEDFPLINDTIFGIFMQE